MISTPEHHNEKLFDYDQIVATAELILSVGQVTELRALKATTFGNRYPGTWFGYFNNAEQVAEAVQTIDRFSGIYLIPNPVDSDILARAANRLWFADLVGELQPSLL